MRYHEINNQIDLEYLMEFPNMRDMLCQQELYLRANQHLLENTEYQNDIMAFNQKYDMIKVVKPIIGNTYWVCEMLTLLTSNMIMIARTSEELKFLSWMPTSKYANAPAMELQGKMGKRLFPFFTIQKEIPPALVDTFVFDSENELDNFLIDCKLTFASSGKVVINDAKLI